MPERRHRSVRRSAQRLKGCEAFKSISLFMLYIWPIYSLYVESIKALRAKGAAEAIEISLQAASGSNPVLQIWF